MNLLGFLGETEEMEAIIDPRPGTSGGIVNMTALRCPQGQTYDVVNQQCVNMPGTQGGNAQALSSWLSSSTNFLGIDVPNVLSLAAVVAGTVYLASKGK